MRPVQVSKYQMMEMEQCKEYKPNKYDDFDIEVNWVKRLYMKEFEIFDVDNLDVHIISYHVSVNILYHVSVNIL